MSGAKLHSANLSYTWLYKTNLSHANLYNAKLIHDIMRNANLYDADLTLADLSGARLIHADLTGVNLTGATVSYSNWTDFLTTSRASGLGSYSYNTSLIIYAGSAPVPESSTYGLMGLGALGVALAARRRKLKTA